ncbi:hypothetical protein BRADI_1g42970v3 [Brachypodium distachyon]|uniref:BURP domain-containing protein n=2 Tax=Brachypodium distachyon TaxID=15368 RepID=A0A0Q3NM03_BRADI|nr:hypothetical protein BRADI_1g42970v3 [Brachypodium distachyon]
MQMHNMDVLVPLISLLLVVGAGGSRAKKSENAVGYWQSVLPDTPIPQAILDQLIPLAVRGSRDSTAIGSGNLKFFNEVRKIGHDYEGVKSEAGHVHVASPVEEGLKEVSVSYGSQGKVDLKKGIIVPKQKFPNNLKKLSMTHRSQYRGELEKIVAALRQKVEENLKEVSVSYGSKDAEDLKEVSVSYGLKGEKSLKKVSLNPKKIIAAHKPHIGENLKEVSVSHGSKDAKVLKEISVSYGLEGENDLKEVSVSYGVEGEKNLKEVSVSYGVEGKKDLKEVSVSYGVEGEKDLKEVSVSNGVKGEGILKEISVSYGVEGGPYLYRAEQEKSLTKISVPYGIEQEGKLKEVSVSYVLDEGKDEHLLKQDEEDPNKVTMSYGAEHDEDDPNKATMSYGAENDEDDPNKATMSYGAEQEEDPTMSYGAEQEEDPTMSYGAEQEEDPTMSYEAEHDEVDPNKATMSYGTEHKEDRKKVFMRYGTHIEGKNKRSIFGNLLHKLDGSTSSKVTGGESHHHHHQVDAHTHRNRRQQQADVFFFHNMLRPGSMITPTIPPTTSLPMFLPRHVASSIPFSTSRLADIIAMFAPASLAMRREIRWTLDTCEHPRTLPGQAARCATSLESLADVPASLLGTQDIRAFSAANLPVEAPGTSALRSRYNVTALRKVSGESEEIVTCHDLTYPYAVYYCHTANPTAAYMVTLQLEPSEEGGAASQPAEMEALAVCHLDTSQWSPKNPFFELHSVKPGDVAVCHFLTKLSIIWVRAADQGSGTRASM